MDNDDYNALLNATDEGVMAYPEIPSINVMLPIYHGVENGELSKGIGHLPETSLPVGGESTHSVLAGHSGMSSARLLTDLPKLKEGDVFYIHVYQKEQVMEILELLTETVCTARKTVRVAGNDFPTEIVKARLLKLTAEHVRFVLGCMSRNTTQIRNIKQYLLTALYNAPTTIDNYYTAMVRHDMATPS